MSQAAAHQLTPVDSVLTQQAVRLEPVLGAISNFLDAHCELIAQACTWDRVLLPAHAIKR